ATPSGPVNVVPLSLRMILFSSVMISPSRLENVGMFEGCRIVHLEITHIHIGECARACQIAVAAFVWWIDHHHPMSFGPQPDRASLLMPSCHLNLPCQIDDRIAKCL